MKEVTIQLQDNNVGAPFFVVYAIMCRETDGREWEFIAFHDKDLANDRCRLYNETFEDDSYFYIREIYVF